MMRGNIDDMLFCTSRSLVPLVLATDVVCQTPVSTLAHKAAACLLHICVSACRLCNHDRLRRGLKRVVPGQFGP